MLNKRNTKKGKMENTKVQYSLGHLPQLELIQQH